MSEDKRAKVFDLGRLYTEEEVEKWRERLAQEVGRNEKWQQMFEEILEASNTMALFIKETYLTKRIEVDRLVRLYSVADATEQATVAYRKRKEVVDRGEKGREEVNDV